MELDRFKQLLESQLGNVKPLLYEQEEEVIITNHDNDYDYKKVGDKFYFKLKENPKSSRAKSLKTQGKYIDWTESAGAGLESIKKSVYKINPEGSAGGGSSTETPKDSATTDTPKEPEKKTGCVWGDCVNGKGKYVYDDSRYYVGDWKDDMKNGKGKMVWGDGEYVLGEFKDGLPNGYVQDYLKNGKLLFSGLYKQNRRIKGTLYYDDGSYYRGNFKDDLPNGLGVKYGVDDKIIFSGEWVNGEPKKK